MSAAINEKLVTGSAAIMALVGTFIIVQFIRSPAQHVGRKVITAENIVSAYTSKNGFTPFVYRNEGATGWFTMLDIIPEDGPFVRWVDVVITNNYQGLPAFATYDENRTNCSSWQFQSLRGGFPVDQIKPYPNNQWYALEAGSRYMEGSYEACRWAGKIS